jgi:hypothetical protein
MPARLYSVATLKQMVVEGGVPDQPGVRAAVWKLVMVGPGMHCSPRHRMPFGGFHSERSSCDDTSFSFAQR